jgi:hypothetical protein
MTQTSEDRHQLEQVSSDPDLNTLAPDLVAMLARNRE